MEQPDGREGVRRLSLLAWGFEDQDVDVRALGRVDVEAPAAPEQLQALQARGLEGGEERAAQGRRGDGEPRWWWRLGLLGLNVGGCGCCGGGRGREEEEEQQQQKECS